MTIYEIASMLRREPAATRKAKNLYAVNLQPCTTDEYTTSGPANGLLSGWSLVSELFCGRGGGASARRAYPNTKFDSI